MEDGTKSTDHVPKKSRKPKDSAKPKEDSEPAKTLRLGKPIEPEPKPVKREKTQSPAKAAKSPGKNLTQKDAKKPEIRA